MTNTLTVTNGSGSGSCGSGGTISISANAPGANEQFLYWNQDSFPPGRIVVAESLASSTSVTFSGDNVDAYVTAVYGAVVPTAYGNYRSWIPFVVNIAKDTVLTSVSLAVIATQTNTSAGTGYIILGCDNTGNATAPTNYNELNMRTLTASTVTDLSQPIWVAGTTYTFNLLAPVQEIINHASWVSGNTLAVIIQGGSGSSADAKLFASYENSTYDEPKLTITY